MAERGRPSLYSEELIAEICERLALGESLREIARDDHIPDRATIFRWLTDPKHKDFHDRYARARELQAESLFEEMQEIADDGRNDWMEKRDKDGNIVGWQVNGEAVARSKLRLDDRRWRAGKLKPKAYGDRIVQEHTGETKQQITVISGVPRTAEPAPLLLAPEPGPGDDLC